MSVECRSLSLFAGAVAIAAALGGPALAVDPSRLANADQAPNDWLTYHGTYRSYHFSPLDQINAGNVKQLKVAWMHQPGRATRGLQSMPLVADGTLYYSGSYSRVFALDGATGQVKWTYFPKLDDDLVAAQTHSPYNRGIALGHGKVYRRHGRWPPDRARHGRPASRPGTPSSSIPRSSPSASPARRCS